MCSLSEKVLMLMSKAIFCSESVVVSVHSAYLLLTLLKSCANWHRSLFSLASEFCVFCKQVPDISLWPGRRCLQSFTLPTWPNSVSPIEERKLTLHVNCIISKKFSMKNGL